jgi:hypothetical protein
MIVYEDSSKICCKKKALFLRYDTGTGLINIFVHTHTHKLSNTHTQEFWVGIQSLHWENWVSSALFTFFEHLVMNLHN